MITINHIGILCLFAGVWFFMFSIIASRLKQRQKDKIMQKAIDQVHGEFRH